MASSAVRPAISSSFRRCAATISSAAFAASASISSTRFSRLSRFFARFSFSCSRFSTVAIFLSSVSSFWRIRFSMSVSSVRRRLDSCSIASRALRRRSLASSSARWAADSALRTSASAARRAASAVFLASSSASVLMTSAAPLVFRTQRKKATRPIRTTASRIARMISMVTGVSPSLVSIAGRDPGREAQTGFRTLLPVVRFEKKAPASAVWALSIEPCQIQGGAFRASH